MSTPRQIPLAVDLDGTLLRTDTLFECLARLLQKAPWLFLLVPFWLLRGRAHLKDKLAAAAELDPGHLPLTEPFVAWLQEQHAAGRPLWLVTAANRRIADAVAARCGFFTGVLASDESVNLKGTAKRDALVAKFGHGGFAYAGDSRADLPVWEAAAEVIVVNATPTVLMAARRLGKPGRQFRPTPTRLRAWAKAIRPHQWAKNLLVGVPLVTAHRWMELEPFLQTLAAFAAFSATASAVYLLNDLADLASDRRHPTKYRRPFASGTLPLSAGFVSAPLLFLAGFGVGTFLSGSFVALLLAYMGLTWAYTLHLKRIAIVDVVVLGLLYLLRIWAGAAAIGVEVSFWLLAFALFIFLSLGLLKRSVELLRTADETGAVVAGRGYQAEDRLVVGQLGTAAAFAAVLVVALYVRSPEVATLYARPAFLWGACPVLVWWLGRVWLLAQRGQVDDDPVVFALRDPASWAAGVLMVVLALLAGPA